jgi:REP element-mobilizing transposase RayT
MANTYHQIYIQTVFPVKYRKAVIDEKWRSELCGVIGNLINEMGCKTLIVNGYEDHIHCFFALKPSISVSEVMKSVKSKSSKWVNEQVLTSNRFEWQKGFGCFSYGHSQIQRVFDYIKNQEEHHKERSFHEEYVKLLEHFDIDYNEKYLFHKPI